MTSEAKSQRGQRLFQTYFDEVPPNALKASLNSAWQKHWRGYTKVQSAQFRSGALWFWLKSGSDSMTFLLSRRG
jgi:hypothetical protein